MGYVYVAATVALTVYGQVVYKWIADDADEFPTGTGRRIDYLVRILIEPRMISVGVATAAAAVTWFLALKRLELAHAYPFMGLSFVGVLLLSAVFFGEAITFWKTAGVVLICLGVVVGSRM